MLTCFFSFNTLDEFMYTKNGSFESTNSSFHPVHKTLQKTITPTNPNYNKPYPDSHDHPEPQRSMIACLVFSLIIRSYSRILTQYEPCTIHKDYPICYHPRYTPPYHLLHFQPHSIQRSHNRFHILPNIL